MTSPPDRPDYRALLLAVDGLVPAPSGGHTEALLRGAEASARDALREQPVDRIPPVASWREAYRAFGAKPQRTRNSLEALLRRAGSGLPRVNRLTDLYNAISVSHRIPVGGEDLTRYAGPPCRRWNWRQARRTQLADDTSAALFILDALDPVTDAALAAAADELSAHLSLLGPDVRVARRLLGESIRP